jgi:hypothetical protein
MARSVTAGTDPFGPLVDQFIPRETRRFTASSASIVDPAAIVAEVFNVDFALDSPQALIAQLNSAVRLPEVQTRGVSAAAAEPRRRMRAPVGPFATTLLAAQVLQESIEQLAGMEPHASVKVDDCDHRTILPLVMNSIAGIVKELSKPEPPLPGLVNAHLHKLCEYKADDVQTFTFDGRRGDLGRLGARLGISAKACSVEDERARSVFTSITRFATMVMQTWHEAQQTADVFVATAIYSLQRDLRGIVVTGERLREKVSAAAWMTNQVQSKPPVAAWDVYQWIHSYASEGAFFDLKRGGRDGIRNVHTTMIAIRNLAETTLKTPVVASPPAPRNACTAAFDDEDVQPIVTELLCHMQSVIDVTARLLK